MVKMEESLEPPGNEKTYPTLGKPEIFLDSKVPRTVGGYVSSLEGIHLSFTI